MVYLIGIVIGCQKKKLFLYYATHNDMENPPTSESLKENNENGEQEEQEEYSSKYYDPNLKKNFYRNGVRPAYLQVHRVLNYKKQIAAMNDT
jgi:hypothetical protein